MSKPHPLLAPPRPQPLRAGEDVPPNGSGGALVDLSESFLPRAGGSRRHPTFPTERSVRSVSFPPAPRGLHLPFLRLLPASTGPLRKSLKFFPN